MALPFLANPRSGEALLPVRKIQRRLRVRRIRRRRRKRPFRESRRRLKTFSEEEVDNNSLLRADFFKTTCSVDDLEASILKQSFYEFVKTFWPIIIFEKAIWNWHIEELCFYLQEAAERVFRGEASPHDILINIPPGTTKSTICSIMFPAWLWTRMPSCRIISASHTHTLAATLSMKSRDIVQSDLYLKLFPYVVIRDDLNSKHYFGTTYGGVRYAAGIDGKYTGLHAHIIIVDDPVDPQEALSEAKLATANRVVSETLPTRKVDKIIAFMLLIMQRLHQEDPSAVMLDDAKHGGTPVKHINLPGVITDPGIKKTVRPRKYIKKYVDGLLDPVRMPKKELDKLRSPRKLGEYGFACQILQTPVPPGGGMFKTDRIVFDQPMPYKHFKQIVRYWDKAGTEGGGAFSAGAFLGEDRNGVYWILHMNRFQYDSWKREQEILRTAQRDAGLCGGKRGYIIGLEQEPGSGGKESAQSSVKMLAGYRVRVTRPTGNKVIRADPFSVQVNGHNVRMVKGEWNADALEELKYFPFSSYKDQVDALSGAFEILTRRIRRAGGMW